MTMKRKPRGRSRFNPMTYFVMGVNEESHAFDQGYERRMPESEIGEMYMLSGPKLKAFVRGWRSAMNARSRGRLKK